MTRPAPAEPITYREACREAIRDAMLADDAGLPDG